MGKSITGICQKRLDDRWVTISDKPSLFKGFKNSAYFSFLLDEMNYIDLNDDAVNDLVNESGWIDSITQLTGIGFSEPGFLTLEELIDLKQDRNNPHPALHNRLIRDLIKLCGSCDYKDIRIVFVCDY